MPARKTSSQTQKKKSARRTARTRPSPPPLTARQVRAAVAVMAEPQGVARFAAGKALALTAATHPDRVYPHFDALAAHLKSASKIVRWNAMQILASLGSADGARKLDALLGDFLGFVDGPDLISAANAIGCAARIAAQRPDLCERVIAGILRVEHATYETPECRNVAIGRALDAMQTLGCEACRRPDVAAFVQRQVDNPRGAVARCARRMTHI